VLLATPGVDYLTSGSIYPFPFGSINVFGTTSIATTSSIYTAGVFFSSSTKAASQFPYASSTMLSVGTASTSNLFISSVPGVILKTDASGNVVPAIPGVDYSTGGTGTLTWEVQSGVLVPTTTIGIFVNASSTIGDGSAGGGLTVDGGFNANGNAFI